MQVQPVVSIPVVGPSPTVTTCPACRANIVTRVLYEATTKTHLMACLTCLLCCPCVCLPYCMDSCKTANHYCPKCGAFVGAYAH